MKTQITLTAHFLSLLLGIFAVPKVMAVPVDCFDDQCAVSDANAFIEVAALPSIFDLFNFEIDANDHLFEQEFYLRFDVGPDPAALDPGNTLADSDEIDDVLALDSATADEDTNTIAASFSDPGGALGVDLSYVLTSNSPAKATVAETLVFTNLSSTDFILLDFFQYTDWDVDDSSDGDSGFFAGPDTMVQTDGDFRATVMALTPFDFFNLALCCEDEVMFDVLDADGNLPGGAGPLGPDDLAHAFQWDDVLLAPGESFTIEKLKMVESVEAVPEPGIWLLLGTGLLGLFGREWARAHRLPA